MPQLNCRMDGFFRCNRRALSREWYEKSQFLQCISEFLSLLTGYTALLAACLTADKSPVLVIGDRDQVRDVTCRESEDDNKQNKI